MAENAIVGFINSIRGLDEQPPTGEPGLPPPVRSVVNIQIPQDADPADREAVLDPRSESSVRNMRLLEGLQRIGVPALIERTPDRVITNVLKPLIGRVVDIYERRDGRLRVQLDGSSASHYITPSPETQASIDLLNASLDRGDVLLVAEDPRRTSIVDVRPYPQDWPPIPGPATEQAAELTEDEVKAALDPKPEREIHAAFQRILGLSCDVDGAQSGCLPFLYATDGCLSRAHRMCELLGDDGIASAKIWMYAEKGETLKPATPNLEACEADWVLHVASVVHAEETGELLVIDPSIFDAPVPVGTFVAAMNSPGADLVFTEQAIYSRLFFEGPGRPEVMSANAFGRRETIADLESFRVDLENMEPPPPFKHCLTKPPAQS